jgi:tetratricopeptide (TPR) repeat protein
MSADLPQFQVGNVGPGATVLQGENISVIGFTAEQVRTLIEAATKGANESVAEAGRRLGVTHGAMRTMLATVGQSNVPDERLVEKLVEVFDQTRKAVNAIAALQPDNAIAQEHVTKASEAAASGDRDEARHHLRAARTAAEAAAQEARRLSREAEAAAARQMLEAARAVAAEAELALTALDYSEAEGLFGEAIELTPAQIYPDEMRRFQALQANAFYKHGYERFSTPALEESVNTWRLVLAGYPRERAPLEWAEFQNNLGLALFYMGIQLNDRESTSKCLEEAVAAFREALVERTREQAPLDWAATQDNLGMALYRLGRLDDGTVYLEKAAAAFRDALTVRTRSQTPVEWAMTQNNLGFALLRLGERETGTKSLEEGIAAINSFYSLLNEPGFYRGKYVGLPEWGSPYEKVSDSTRNNAQWLIEQRRKQGQ